jgi:hypothetical protein
MSRRFRLRRGAAIAVTTAAVLAAAVAASVATGAITSGNGTIHACYSNGDGSLRVHDVEAGKPCPKNFSPIEWSQQGPAGAPGQDGADGQDGAPGPRGPSDIYTTYRDDIDNLPDTSDDYGVFDFGREPVLTLNVPAGSYDIQAKGFANGAKGNVGCVLVAGENIDGSIASLPDDFTAEPLVMQVTHTFAAPGTIELRCTDYGETSSQGSSSPVPLVRHLKWAKLHATKVETIHVQLPQ